MQSQILSMFQFKKKFDMNNYIEIRKDHTQVYIYTEVSKDNCLAV